MDNSSGDVVFFAAGDVGPSRAEPDSIFRHVAPALKTGDLAFCQLEPVLTRRGTPLPQARLAMRADPDGARAIRAAGFDVVSFASNHCMDWGQDGFFDTLDALAGQGLAVIGAGRNLAEASKVTLKECRRTRIAFLGYNSILPQGYWAESNRPGCAPLRAHTLYEQIEHDQPGTPCRIHTLAHRGDLAAMREGIRSAREQADVVVVSIHWGLHFVPATLADYQREMAHAAIDAGADLILGHHAHILKGVEVYRGKVIFYSLANFALESPFAFAENLADRPAHKDLTALYARTPAQSNSPMSADSVKTILVKCLIAGGAIKGVSFLPVWINAFSEPEMLRPNEPRFHEIVQYLREITQSQGLNATYRQDGAQVAVE